MAQDPHYTSTTILPEPVMPVTLIQSSGTFTIAGALRLDSLKGVGSQDVEQFLRRFDQYCTCLNIKDEQALAQPSWHLDGIARLYLESQDPAPSTVDELKTLLRQKFRRAKQVNLEVFPMRQEPRENVDQFLTRLEIETLKTVISDDLQVQIALNGLHPSVSSAISTHGPKTLSEVRQLSSRLSNVKTSVPVAAGTATAFENTMSVVTAAVAQLSTVLSRQPTDQGNNRKNTQPDTACSRCGGRCTSFQSCRAKGETCRHNEIKVKMKSATAKNVNRKPFENTEKNSNPECASTINRQAEVYANFSIEMAKNTVGVSINQLKSNALCDTGATISCVSKMFIDKAFPSEKTERVSSIYKSIKGVGGTSHPVSSSVKLSVNFGSVSFCHEFLVVEDLHHSLILGHDFLTKYQCLVDIPSKLLRIADIEVCSLRTDTGYARTLKPACIRANSEVILPVKVARVCSGTEVLLEPYTTLTKLGIMGAKGLVTVKKGKAVLRLVNPTEKDVHLKGNKVLAEVSTFNRKSIVCIDSDSRLDATVNSFTPSTRNCGEKNIEFDLSNASLSENQKARLLQMLKECIFTRFL